jgi:hypothetical protein
VAHVDDLNRVIRFDNAIENLEAIPPHEHCANAGDVRGLRCLGMSPDEFDGRVDRCQNVDRALRASLDEIVMNGCKVARRL